MSVIDLKSVKAIIGLGNPGRKFEHNRHNIGFRVVDALSDRHGGVWHQKNDMMVAEISLQDHPVILIKPLTYMNSSGAVIPFLQKKGIAAAQILVVHDELEQPFAKVSFKMGGSARGHNGLRSIIAACGDQFPRLRFGIARPADRAQVPDYVLQDFSESKEVVEGAIIAAVQSIERFFE